MSSKTSSYHPLGFLGHLDGNKHIVLLYDDEDRAGLLVARYITDGFDKGGSCVFLSNENPMTIRKRLAAVGVKVDLNERVNRLRILQIPTSGVGKLDILKAVRTVVAKSTQGMKGPFRFVNDIGSADGTLQGMEFEEVGNNHFKEFGISLLCLYDIGKMEPSTRNEWVRGLIQNHHSVIYASEPNKAVAFETDLLEEE